MKNFAGILTALALGVIGPVAEAQETETAIFAGGCFWCVEADFDKIPGVVETVSGYTGGTLADPTYKDVTAGGSGHYEAVKITFDPRRVSYDDLLTAFWRSVDPTDRGGQFCDRGQSYLTGVFVLDDVQRRLAESSKKAAGESLTKPIVTEILEAGPFYPAEDYHQDYHTKNSVKYRYYRWSCGRDRRVKEVWGEQAYRGIKSGQ